MTRQTDTATPSTEAQSLLRAATPDGLLTTFAALTHRIDGTERTPCDHSVAAFLEVRAKAATLRTQRDMVQAEILRRMGA